MTFLNGVGYLASALVVLTFYMKDMVPLRIAALCSNVAFIIYGVGLDLGPVVLLHGILIPLNAWRLSMALMALRVAPRPAVTARRTTAG
jgi:CRP/FNR family transcriptional regulator, cyclic AMP receptor protein